MTAHHAASQQLTTMLVGRSPATLRLRAEIERVAPYGSNVLITGPSGTGKELVARQIHARSPRASQPFIPVDCASMSGELMASQLFGHVAGAFTGANCEALGCFRAAHRGTVFLDEIGELDYPLQAKLLRVLQDHVVTPVGTHQGRQVDVRVVAATNRNLRAAVRDGQFRDDLYYRLDVIHLKTVALRERLQDIDDLATTFLRQLSEEGLPARSLSPEARAALSAFDWPGNVRQLRNVLEQAVIESDGPQLTASLLCRIVSLSFASEGTVAGFVDELLARPAATPDSEEEASGSPRGTGSSAETAWQTLESLERQHIACTLEHTFNNRSAAARLLGISRQALLRKIKRYGLDDH